MLFILDKEPHYLQYLKNALQQMEKIDIFCTEKEHLFFRQLLEALQRKKRELFILEGEVEENFDVENCLKRAEKIMLQEKLEPVHFVHLKLPHAKKCIEHFLSSTLKKQEEHYPYYESQEILDHTLHRFSHPKFILETLKNHQKVTSTDLQSQLFIYLEHPKHTDSLENTLHYFFKQTNKTKNIFLLDFRSFFENTKAEKNTYAPLDDFSQHFLSTLSTLPEHSFNEKKINIYQAWSDPLKEKPYLSLPNFLDSFQDFFPKIENSLFLLFFPSYLLPYLHGLFSKVDYCLLGNSEKEEERENFYLDIQKVYPLLKESCFIEEKLERKQKLYAQP